MLYLIQFIYIYIYTYIIYIYIYNCYCSSPGVVITELQKRGGLSDDKYMQVNMHISLNVYKIDFDCFTYYEWSN